MDNIEIASSYKYLGLILSTTLCPNVSFKDLADRAKVGVIQTTKTLRRIGCFSPSVLFKIFDTQIQPILLYGAELLGVETCDHIEKVHTFAIKRYTCVHSYT